MPVKAIPPGRQARWELLRQLSRDWVRPLNAGDGLRAEEIVAGERRLGIDLPAALRETYLLIGEAEDLVRQQNRLLRPNDLRVNDKHLIIWEENQNVGEWGFPLVGPASDDPPVDFDMYAIGHREGKRWKRQDPTLSEFVLHMFLHDAFLFKHDGLNASGPVEPEMLERAAQRWRRLPFSDWDWPEPPTIFYEAFECLLISSPEPWLWLAARDEGSFERAMDELRKEGIVLDRT